MAFLREHLRVALLIINSDGSSNWRVVSDENLRTEELSFICTGFLT
jgi:hypothetical protein